MPETIPCPECASPLRLGAAVPAGSTVRCRKCGAQFPVPGEHGPPGTVSLGGGFTADAPAPGAEGPRTRGGISGEADTPPPRERGWREDEEGEYGDDRDWKRRFRRDEYDADFERPTLGRFGPLSSDWRADFGKWWSAARQNWGLYLSQSVGYAVMAGGVSLGLHCMGSAGVIAGLFVTPPLWAGFILCAHKCLRGEPFAFNDFWGGFKGQWYLSFVGYSFLCNLLFVPAGVAYVVLLVAADDSTPGRVAPPPEVWVALGAFILALMLGTYYYVRIGLFGTHLIVDRRYRALDAIKGSWELSRGHWWPLFLVALIDVLLFVGGSGLVCFGLLLTVPLIALFNSAMYLDVAGLHRPVFTGEGVRRAVEDEV